MLKLEVISSWILSVLGIIIISLIVEIMLPTGKTSKLIKSVLGLFSVFIIISPIKEVDFLNFDASIFTSKIEIDSSFVGKRNDEIIEIYKEEILENLNNNGYLQVNIDIEINENNLEVKTIFVDIREMVLKSEDMNINKYTNIVAIIKNILKIEEDKIIFYE